MADNKTALHSGPFIPTKKGSCAQLCDTSTLKCTACLYAKASKRSPDNLAPRPSSKKQVLKQDHLKPGDCISVDHYFSPIIGQIPHTFGKERSGYTCGSLFVDYASGKIFNFPQYSTNAFETIKNTLRLKALAMEEGFKVKEYHSNNGIFSSTEFKEHCTRQHQKYLFSGVGAKHQNGIAKRNIKMVVQWAPANMLHVATHWPQHANSKYWPQAIDYAAWVFNRLPNMESGIAQNEIWSGVCSPSSELSCAHVFGCPVYVLDVSLQDGRKIPKWNPCARLSLFLGFSDLHSSLVPLVLNVATGHISPQFHVIFDNKFETVNSLPLDQPLKNQWAQIIALGRKCFMDVNYDENDRRILPPLSDIIKSYSEARRLQQENEPMMAIGGDPIEDIDFTRANPPENPTIMSTMNDLKPVNGNIFSAPTNFYPPNPSQVSEGVNDIE